uniref:RING-type domain-containing protein n=1 Tax=Gouania willdenowi TaxID=441366 RepID=A0A8C5EUF9_GOUWI
GFRTRIRQIKRLHSALPLPLPSPGSAVPSPSTGPGASRLSVDSGLDLDCSICFSQFNNVFRCPKMLRCRHTFCLECLARINVKSSEPDAVQCPLCRRRTPLPALGPPRLATDRTVLSRLPDAMQRVYSVRFVRNKGKLQVKRSEGAGRVGVNYIFQLQLRLQLSMFNYNYALQNIDLSGVYVGGGGCLSAWDLWGIWGWPEAPWPPLSLLAWLHICVRGSAWVYSSSS